MLKSKRLPFSCSALLRRVLPLTLAALSIRGGVLIRREVEQERWNRALIAAAKRNDVPAGLEALEHGADPNARDKTPSLSLPAICTHLLHGGTARVQKGEPPLSLLFWDDATNTAPSGDPFPFVKALLEHGANPDPNDAAPALVYAASSDDRRPLRALLRAGAGDHDRALCDNALWQMVMNHDPQDVETLLEKGADPNYDPGRCDMLVYAVWTKDEATVKVLLRHGADPNIVCRQGVTALDEAKVIHLTRIEWILRQAGARR